MRANHMGISEPVGGAAVDLEKLDLVLMPLVAWDRQGRRLGMGGGYYDRAFKRVLGLDRPERVGVAWSLQEADELPQESWDVSLHAVVTEKEWFTCPS